MVTLSGKAPALAKQFKSKSVKVASHDPMVTQPEIACCSSSELAQHADESFDLVITDPPLAGYSIMRSWLTFSMYGSGWR